MRTVVRLTIHATAAGPARRASRIVNDTSFYADVEARDAVVEARDAVVEARDAVVEARDGVAALEDVVTAAEGRAHIGHVRTVEVHTGASVVVQKESLLDTPRRAAVGGELGALDGLIVRRHYGS